MKHLDLCSGIGGFSLAFESEGFETVGFAEVDPYCSQVLEKNWPSVPNYGDVKEIANDPTTLPEFDILTAGYPCQPFSTSGQKRGEADPRHLWPNIRKIVQSRKPSWCVFENVVGHINLGIDTVLSDLEEDGYETRPFVIPAVAVDAPHKRLRVWILAYTSSGGQHKQGAFGKPLRPEAHQDRKASQPVDGGLRQVWQTEPNVGRVADGIPDQSHRVKSLGNAIVPQVAQRMARCIRLAND